MNWDDALWQEREEIIRFESLKNIEPMCQCDDVGEEECPLHKPDQNAIKDEQIEKLSKKTNNKRKKAPKKESVDDILIMDTDEG